MSRIGSDGDSCSCLRISLADRTVSPPCGSAGGDSAGTEVTHVVVDSELTPGKMLEFAGVLRSVDPAEITTYQIEASPHGESLTYRWRDTPRRSLNLILEFDRGLLLG